MRRSKEFAAVVREFADRGDQWLLESPENLLVHHRRKSKEGERLKEKIQDKVRVTRGRKAAQVMARTLAEQLMEQGFDRGRVQTQQNTLLGQMSEKFGSVPERITKKVRSLQDTETLDRLLRLLIHANTLEDMDL